MRLIDVDSMIDNIHKYVIEKLTKGGDALEVGSYIEGLGAAIKLVSDAETIGIVKPAYWEKYSIGKGIYYRCSECLYNLSYTDNKTNYCPNCGAKMEVKNND